MPTAKKRQHMAFMDTHEKDLLTSSIGFTVVLILSSTSVLEVELSQSNFHEMVGLVQSVFILLFLSSKSMRSPAYIWTLRMSKTPESL